MISFSSLLVLHCSILFIIRLLEELVKRKWMHICFSASLWDKISFSNLGNIVQSKKVSLWYLLSVCTEHLKSSFRTQQCAVQGRDSRHLLNGESWQRNGGAVREKPGYTLHCVACTVTLLEASEMRSLVAWVCAQNSKSIWSFGADRKRHRWAQTGQFQSRFIFMQHQIQFGELLFSELLQKSTPASYVRCIFLNVMSFWSLLSCLKWETTLHLIS